MLKKSKKILQGIKRFMTLDYEVIDDKDTKNNTVNSENHKKENNTVSTINIVGICPKCKRGIVEDNGYYSCTGIFYNSCDYQRPAHFEGVNFSFDEIVRFEKYNKMMKAGFLDDNDNLSENIDEENSKTSYTSSKSLGTCPKCGGNIINNHSEYSCSDCDYKLKNSFSRTAISPSVIETLLKGQNTDWMSFKKKDGTTYKSKLTLDAKTYNYALVSSKKTASKSSTINGNKNKKDTEHKKNNENTKEISSTINKKILGKCPVCSNNVISGNTSYGCMGLKDKSCGFKLPFIFEDMDISSEDMTTLLKGGTILKTEGDNEEVFLKMDNNGNLERVPF